MRELLWKEMADAKHDQEYACLMMALKSRQLRRYNIFMAAFSTTGIFSWKIWEWIPSITCAIIAFLSIVKLTEQYIVPSEKQIDSYNKISSFYTSLFIKLQKVWFESEKGIIDEQKAFSKLQVLQNSQKEIHDAVNNVHKKVNKKISEQATEKANLYFKQVYKV